MPLLPAAGGATLAISVQLHSAMGGGVPPSARQYPRWGVVFGKYSTSREETDRPGMWFQVDVSAGTCNGMISLAHQENTPSENTPFDGEEMYGVLEDPTLAFLERFKTSNL